MHFDIPYGVCQRRVPRSRATFSLESMIPGIKFCPGMFDTWEKRLNVFYRKNVKHSGDKSFILSLGIVFANLLAGLEDTN